MKLSYYTYSLDRHVSGERFLCDLRKFLSSFSAFDDIEFKNRFTHSGESVYLYKAHADLYAFIITRSNEIIKKIRSSDLSISEISDMLQGDEHLGFVSYVYFGNKFIGYASTIMAPKAMSFSNFFNQILDAVQIHEYRFNMHPVFQDTTIADALMMPFIGRSAIQVTKESSVYEDLRNIFGGSAEDFVDVDSFEIVIKPKPRQNIETAVKKVMKKVPKDGLEKFICNAKEELHEQLTEHYLVGKGILSDLISKGSDIDVHNAIKEKISNEGLVLKLRELDLNDGYTKKLPDVFADFAVAAAWSDRLSSL